MTPRRAYGQGSIHRAHRKDCPHKGDREAKCGCKWRGTMDRGFTESGGRRRITVTADSEAQASRKLSRRDTEIQKAEGNATAPDANRKTVHSWAADWLPLRQETMRPKTYERSVTMVRKYVDPTIGRKRLVDLTARDIRAVDAKVRAKTSEENVRAIRFSLMAMLRDAIGEGYSVPASIFEASKSKGEAAKQKAPRRKALEVPEAVAVLAQAAQEAHYARWVAGFYQGQRQGESLGLTWDAVDMDRGIVTLEWQLQKIPYIDKGDRSQGFRVPIGYETRYLVGAYHLVRPKTQAGYRVAPMAEEFHDALTAWREVWPENEHGLIWARANGWPIDKAGDASDFRDLQVAAGVHKAGGGLYTGHEMRNTCATILTLAGVDPVTITAILGHSSWSTSLGYVTSQIDHMRAALKGVNAAYQPKELG